MKTNTIAFFALLLSCLTLPILAQAPERHSSFDKQWQQIDTYIEKDRPQSAQKIVKKILLQAQKEKNYPQVIKAMVHDMRFEIERDTDKAAQMVQTFEQMADTTQDIPSKALMQLMVAQLYNDYQQTFFYKISTRTDIDGYKPKQIEEWTANMFSEKIEELLTKALKNKQILQQTNILDYDALLQKGRDSRTLKPTLFDFVAYESITLLQKNNHRYNQKQLINSIYQEVIDFNREKNNQPALIYATLQLTRYLYQNTEQYLPKLQKIIQQYQTQPAIVEAIYLQAQQLIYQREREQAHRIITKGIELFPTYERIELLKNLKKNLEEKTLSTQANDIVKPHSQLSIKLITKNIENIELTTYNINTTAKAYHEYQKNSDYNTPQLHPKHTYIHTQNVTIQPNKNFDQVETTVSIPTHQYGIYEVIVKEKNSTKNGEKIILNYVVTDFSYITKNKNNNTTEIFVLDRVSGKTIKGVHIEKYRDTWEGEKSKLKSVLKTKTDKNGWGNIDHNNEYGTLFFQKGKDAFFSSRNGSFYYRNSRHSTDQQRTALFTDRSLYRPGQIIYFKGITYQQKAQTTVANQKINVSLHNANGEKIADKKLKTNKFGSFSDQFVLPTDQLNGAYSIRTSDNASLSIQVEAYKRPTFEVRIDRPTKEVRFGEKIKLYGEVKAYAGHPLPNATIKYRIVKRLHRYSRYLFIFPMNDKNIASGTTKSRLDGTFDIDFTPQKEQRKTSRYDEFYTYTIYAEVTDSKGETQRGEQTLSVGEKSLFILPNIPSKIEKSNPTHLSISTQTINGKEIAKNIDYQLIRLQSSDIYYENSHDTTQYRALETVKKGTFNSQDSLILHLNKFPSGGYKILFSTQDNKGKKVTREEKFILYSQADKRPPIKVYQWLVPIKTEVAIGESALVKFGTSTKDTQVLYELMDGNDIIERKWITLDNEIKTFLIPFKASYKGGIHLLLTFVKDEQLFTQKITIKKRIEKKKLLPSFSVFRDKLKPGEKAKWTAHIPSPTDTYQQAELLISMYDASLDAIRIHQWYFDPTYRPRIEYTQTWSFEEGREIYDYTVLNKNSSQYVKPYQFDAINWFKLPLWYRVSTVGSMTLRPQRMAKAGHIETATIDDYDKENLKVSQDIATLEQNNTTVEKREHKEVQIRENFNETAFFYPQLHTDKEGNINIEFTVPESLTKWHINLLAHNPNLYFGQNQMEAITQKELMVEMNLPRFIRQSDSLTLIANLTNLTQQVQQTDLTLNIIDPNTKEVIFTQQAKHPLNPKETIPTEWKLPAITSHDMVICKIVAQNDQFSDGEQKYLPILPDKILVTESLPMTIRANKTKTFNFKNFTDNFATVHTSNFTVEWSNNPTWYAIQALPTLSTPTHENAIAYLTAYYSNALAKHIVETTPHISDILKIWGKESNSEEKKTLHSQLEKNETLKNILLAETPWLMEAKNETAQKKQIATLLHTNQQAHLTHTLLNKLFDFQHPNGGFSWFKEMPQSRYTTQEVLLQLARLQTLTNTNYSKQQKINIKRAIRYLDRQIAKDFDWLKKHQPNDQTKNVISPTQIAYLYLRMHYPTIPIVPSAVEAVEFYTTQSEKYWVSFSLYLRSLTAIIAHKNGKKTIAKEILTSLKENALTDKQMGMYWAKNRAGRYWNQRPIDTQTSLIEAFSLITNDTASIENMKIWLLKQKQTHQWNTPISTVNAIYTLIKQGNNWLQQSGNTTLHIGDTTLNTSPKEAGTGYIKQQIPTDQLQPQMGTITVQNSSTEGIAWGAAYWQYFQKIDQITNKKGKEMQLTKKLFVQKQQNQQTILIPIENTTLQKGDKIITRLTLTTEQDMEFVAINDLRAGCLEPVQQISTTKWKEGVIYYQTSKDTSTSLFFYSLPKGTYVFEYASWVNNAGTFTSGIATVQCQYAPEFVNHTGGEKIIVP